MPLHCNPISGTQNVLFFLSAFEPCAYQGIGQSSPIFVISVRYYAFFPTPLRDTSELSKMLISGPSEGLLIAFLSPLFFSRYFRTTMPSERLTSFRVRSLYRFYFGLRLHFLYQRQVVFGR
jgi:hypothetical protein